MNLESLVGQTLDGKYKIERELGRGGMGAVFFSTHLGTERPVAVKVIAPQFMERSEFVQRFRREARAAGRLRHPNVVDVTDFGFADTSDGRVAYLVMEYLDGCTLGEILDEEKQLPLEWTLDILEQVCSAVNEAHEQGIIHRDLKPDNIWLEPNQRGSYTVKVLDFGIAKLEESYDANLPQGEIGNSTRSIPTSFGDESSPTGHGLDLATQFFDDSAATRIESGMNTESDESEMRKSNADVNPDAKTKLFLSNTDEPERDDRSRGTALVSRNSLSDSRFESSGSDITRVGAVLGTPLYMSPEQCHGQKLDTRSDIYSLAVIAYQMLSGKTPFSGEFRHVMDCHRTVEPPPIETKKIRRKVKTAIARALSKDPDQRPQTAEIFSNQLRAHSEGVAKLMQRALVIWSEHLQIFIWVSFLLSLPAILLTLLFVGFQYFALAKSLPIYVEAVVGAVYGISTFFVNIWFGSALIGVTTWIVAQILAVPLKEVSWRPAFGVVKTHWRTIARTVTTTTIIATVTFALCILPGIYFSVRYGLVSPIIMMEGLRGKAAIARSVELVKRAYSTSIATMLIYIVLPVILSGATAAIISSSVRMGDENPSRNKNAITISEDTVTANGAPEANSVVANSAPDQGEGQNLSEAIKKVEEELTKTDDMKMSERIRKTVNATLIQLVWLPISILLSSFSSITFALLYLKTRQAGGESLSDLLAQFEVAERPRNKWQNRIRERLLQSGRTPSGH